jgi:alkylhydroperoxidase/carboxymuconolactone decarboxylase family protein YurZ
MDEKTEIMIALGVAIGVNCIPCFDYLYSKSREVELEEDEVRAIAEIAIKVKNGASIFMKNTIAEALGDKPTAEQPCCSQTSSSSC